MAINTVTRTELPDNTPEQVRGYLVAALELVDSLEVPDDLRPAVFREACRLVAGKQILIGEAAPIGAGLMLPRVQ